MDLVISILTSDLAVSILTGILSGVIASMVFLALTRFLRPKILISDHLSVYPTGPTADKKEVVRLKIVNQRMRAAADVSVTVYAEHKRKVHDGEVKVRKEIGNKFTTHVIEPKEPKRRRAKDFDNARRIRIDYKDLVQALAYNEDKYLVVEVYARDALSGVGAVFTQSYSLGTDKFTLGSYKVGNGTEVVPYKGDDPFRLPSRIKAARDGDSEAWLL